MLIQFIYGFLSGISITFLKDTDGPFTNVTNFDLSIIKAFVSPVEDVSAKFIPLAFEDIFVRFHEKFFRFIWWDAIQN